MAAVSDCFSLGSTVWCKTCYDKEIEGEVLAFDPNTKVLILKCLTIHPQSQHPYSVYFVNLQLVSELQVKREVTTVPEIPQSLNLHKLNTRIKNQVDEKKRLLNSMTTNISAEGQRLFVAISKTISEVRWSNSNIVVWDNDVTIYPPYQLEDIKGGSNSKGYSYVRKVVEKYMKDAALLSNTPTQ